MALPTWVNNGTQNNTASATSLAPAALPASRVNNNILIAFIGIKATGKSPTVGGGWASPTIVNTGNQTGAYTWRLVDGAEAVPTFSWSGAAAATTQIMQFSGNATVSPIDTNVSAAGNSSTSATIASFSTTADNDLILDIYLSSVSQTMGTYDGYTQRAVLANANTSYAVNVGSKGATGSVPAASLTITSSNWATFGFGLKGSGSGTSNIRASQNSVQVLESYSDATNLLVSQNSVQVLESYSDATNLLVSQVSLQVLRSQNTPKPSRTFIIG